MQTLITLLVTDVRNEMLKQQQQGYKEQRQKTLINVTAETHRWSKRDEVGSCENIKHTTVYPDAIFRASPLLLRANIVSLVALLLRSPEQLPPVAMTTRALSPRVTLKNAQKHAQVRTVQLC